MDAAQFVAKWTAATGKERSTSQEHFIDLCRLLGEATPNEADPTQDFFVFEKGAKGKNDDGFADVWLKNKFAWEYKGKKKDLVKAYEQVQRYREALGNPPLLIVCDLNRFEIHTNWTNTESWIYQFSLSDIGSDQPVSVNTIAGPAENAPELSAVDVLRSVFADPDRLKPQRTTDQITMAAASYFGDITKDLRDWKVDDMRIARFITRVLFCMFAADVGLLPRETFSQVIEVHKTSGDNKAFRKYLADLFKVMNKGGKFNMRVIPHFDGHLFADSDVPDEINTQHILTLAKLDALNWTAVEPSIFGTLFERILDPSQRQKLGAHYTSRADIELIVEPVLMMPLRREWADTSQEVERLLERKTESRVKKATKLLRDFVKKLSSIRVLDPACGSGNFLYVSLALLKALEKEVIAVALKNKITIKPQVHPRQLLGLETNHYAVELASIVIWIGYLQWKHKNVMRLDDEEPILQPLQQVRLMDAILDGDKEPDWPEADIIVGNPPFLGGKRLKSVLSADYVDRLFKVWDGRVPRESDLCCYWFEKARTQIQNDGACRAGLLATNSIRQKQNRRVLEKIIETGGIFYAQADRKWIQNGVAVRVSMVGFDDGAETARLLNELPDDDANGALDRARPVPAINANLTGGASNLTAARRLKENIGVAFMGDTKVGSFEIPESLAHEMLNSPNPHGRSNSDVVRPWVNGLDITRRPRGMWIVDFPADFDEQDAAKYQAPFEYIKEHVKPERKANNRAVYAERWWVHGEPRPAMRQALAPLSRYLATVSVARHRLFAWLPSRVLADHRLFVFARDDDYFFGVLHSRAHELWSLRLGSTLEDRPAYLSTTSFETFPFPKPTATQKAEVARAAKELNELRENWLNPDAGPLGLPSDQLKKLTLTNLYNERPTWLANAHAKLDAAVFAAYGWPEDPASLADSVIIERLLALNLQREPAD
jgi:type II restriction/modification system DNA methylase subunit YeeA